MMLQLFLGYTYIGGVEINPDAVLNHEYLETKKKELLENYKDKIGNSRSKPLYFIESTSIAPMTAVSSQS